MATWVRSNTNSPSATDDVPLPFNTQVTLGNATAPADFDPAAINSVRIQYDLVITGISDDTWTDYQEATLTDGAPTLASVDGGNATRTANGTYSKDITDNSPSNAATTTDWENATLRVGANGAWALWNKDKGPDGTTATVNNVTVTIDYTPGAAAQNLTGTLFTSSPSFGAGTVTPGTAALTGTLFTSSPQFNGGTVGERTFTLEQVASATGVADAKVTVTYGSATTSGNLLLAGVFSRESTKPPVPSGWTEELAVEDTTNADWFVMYSKESDGTETSVTLGQTGGGNDFNAGWIAEYSGFSGTPTVETAATAGASYAVNSLDVSSGTVTNTPALMVASHTARDWAETVGNAISYDSLFEERADEGGGSSGATWTHIGMADAENTDGASDTATMTPNETAMDMMAGMLVIYDATGSQALTGTTFQASPQFNTGTVTPGSVALTGSLFQASPQFNAGTVTPGSVALTGALFTSSPSFGGGTITLGAVALTGTTFTTSPSFGGGTVTPGSVALTGSLFSASPQFNAGTVVESQALTDTNFSWYPSFYAGTVTPGAAPLTGSLFSASPSFGGGTVTPGAVALTGTTFTVPPEFYGGTVVQSQALTGSLFTTSPQFNAGEMGPQNPPEWVSPTPADGTVNTELQDDTMSFNFPLRSHQRYRLARLRGVEAARYKFTAGLENWRAEFQCTVAHDSTVADGALKMTISASGQNSAIESVPSRSLGDLQTYGIDVAEGEQYATMLRVTSNHVPSNLTGGLLVRTYFYNSSGGFVGQSAMSETGDFIQPDDEDLGLWKARVAATPVTIPANAAHMILNLYVSSGSWAANDEILLDEIVVARVDEVEDEDDSGQWLSGVTPVTWSGAQNTQVTGTSTDDEANATDHFEGLTSKVPANYEVWYIGSMRVSQLLVNAEFDATPIRSIQPTQLQNLTGTTFTASPSFGGGVVSQGETPLTGVLFAASPQFNVGTVTAGAVALTGTTFQVSPSFGGGTVTPGSVALTGSLFAAAPSFPGGTITTGGALVGNLFELNPVFFSGTVSPGAVDLTGTLFTSSPSFPGGVVAPAQSLSGSLFTLSPTFYVGEIVGLAASGQAITGDIFRASPAFPTGAVLGGTRVVSPHWRWRMMRVGNNLVLLPVRNVPASSGDVVSDVFKYNSSYQAYAWAAVRTAWASNSGASTAILKAAINTALDSAGFEGPQGESLV